MGDESDNGSVDQNLAADDHTVTMVDVLQEEEEMEAELAAVLGGSDDKHCTYSQGYIKRQALYACLTCVPDARTDPTKRAGVCLACCYRCHETHELVELYTKRSFRCDCGTPRMLAGKCLLDATKLDVNEQNLYNQNFSGVYCTCSRPYPDPDDCIDDEMIQCIVCEDWFHCRHLNVGKMPSMTSFAEMICGDCVGKHDFLASYAGLSVRPTIETVDDPVKQIPVADESVDVKPTKEIIESETSTDEPVEQTDRQLSDEINQCILDIIEINKGIGESGDDSSTGDVQIAKKRKIDPELGTSAVAGKCKRPEKTVKTRGATFWPIDWRSWLCKCQKCLCMYRTENVEYLIDAEDTVHNYEQKGLEKTRETDYDRGMRALSNMDHVKQVDAIISYNRMQEKLKQYLKSFVVNKQVVTEDDITRFFRMMKEKN